MSTQTREKLSDFAFWWREILTITIRSTPHSVCYMLLTCPDRLFCQLELRHYRSLPSRSSSTSLFPTWMNGSGSSVQDVFVRLDQYKRQLLSGVLCINMDLRGSFKTGLTSPDSSRPFGFFQQDFTARNDCFNVPRDEKPAKPLSRSKSCW